MSTLTKGVIYKGIEDAAIPAGIRKGWVRLGLNDVEKQDWVSEHNLRSAIVATCECGKELVREELRSHAMQCVAPEIRHLVRMLAALPGELVNEVIACFDEDGELKV